MGLRATSSSHGEASTCWGLAAGAEPRGAVALAAALCSARKQPREVCRLLDSWQFPLVAATAGGGDDGGEEGEGERLGVRGRENSEGGCGGSDGQGRGVPAGDRESSEADDDGQGCINKSSDESVRRDGPVGLQESKFKVPFPALDANCLDTGFWLSDWLCEVIAVTALVSQHVLLHPSCPASLRIAFSHWWSKMPPLCQLAVLPSLLDGLMGEGEGGSGRGRGGEGQASEHSDRAHAAMDVEEARKAAAASDSAAVAHHLHATVKAVQAQDFNQPISPIPPADALAVPFGLLSGQDEVFRCPHLIQVVLSILRHHVADISKRVARAGSRYPGDQEQKRGGEGVSGTGGVGVYGATSLLMEDAGAHGNGGGSEKSEREGASAGAAAVVAVMAHMLLEVANDVTIERDEIMGGLEIGKEPMLASEGAQEAWTCDAGVDEQKVQRAEGMRLCLRQISGLLSEWMEEHPSLLRLLLRQVSLGSFGRCYLNVLSCL